MYPQSTFCIFWLVLRCENATTNKMPMDYSLSKLSSIKDGCFFVAACPTLIVPDHSALSPSDPSEFYAGKTVSMICDTGYTAVGVEHVTCLSGASGAWNDTYGTCEQGILI